ncbi:hypothetical protein N9937_02255 [bacterium]|nr:hypothetical protein [bacterium]
MSTGEQTWGAIKGNWPILLVIFSLVVSGVRNEMTVQQQGIMLKAHEQMLDRQAFSEFAVWKNNVKRDIKELQKSCSP